MSAPPASRNRALAAAKYYIGELGWALVELPPGRKGPDRSGWNAPGGPINTVARAVAIWSERPTWGIGLVHGPSRTCAVDVDDLDGARAILAPFRLDLDRILSAAVGIESGRPGRAKAVFALPPDITSLPCRRLLQNGRVVIELRAGPVQDVLPPSIHPDTQRPYRWRGHPADTSELPEALAAFWLQCQAEGAPPGAGDGTGPIHERHLVLSSIAGAMRRRGASIPAIKAALLVENATRCVPPLPEKEVARIARSIGRYQPAPGDADPGRLPVPGVAMPRAPRLIEVGRGLT